MELKKSKDANIENLRLPIRIVGFLFVGSIVLAAFSYTTAVDNGKKNERQQAVTEINFQEEVQTPEETPPPPPPPPQVDVEPPIDDDIEEKKNEEKEPVATIPPPPPPAPTGPKEVKKIKTEIVDFPDVEAGFPGGAAAMQKWIAENVEYPQVAREMGDQGRVYLSFVVETDGSITNIEVKRGVSEELDREAKRVIRKMPKWNPGEAGGKKVRTRCSLPINFTLE